MKTLQEEWKAYRDACYPEGTEATQNRECHQAFMAGAFIALSAVDKLSYCPDDDLSEKLAAEDIGKLLSEATEFTRLRCLALKMPRN